MIDFVGAAETCLESFEGVHPHITIFDDMETQNPEEVARLMQDYLDEEIIEALVETKVGRGVLLGMISSYKLFVELGCEVIDDDK